MSLYRSIVVKMKNIKFSHKLFIAFFSALAVTLLPLGIYSYHQSRSSYIAQEKQSIKEQIWQTNLMFDAQMLQYQSVMTSLLYNQQIAQTINTEDISYYQQYLMFDSVLEPIIDGIMSSNSNIVTVKIFTDNPTLKGHSKYLYDLDNMFGEVEVEEGKIEVLDSLRYQIQDQFLAGICRFPQSNDDMNHYLYVEFRIRDLLTLLTNHDYLLEITDVNHNEIYASTQVKNEICTSTQVKDINTKESIAEFEEIQIGDSDYYMIPEEISNVNWNALYFVPADVFALNDNSILQATFLTMFLAFVICMIISGIFSRLVMSPLQKLQRNIEKMEAGNFTMKVSSSAEDEIGQLMNAFGRMAEKLNILINQVYRSRLTQKEAEFKMLQAQLNPHFLYNTLSFINWSALKIGAAEIAKISRDISSFYRTTLNSGKMLTEAGEELINARSYINIQLALHNDSFDVDYVIQEECLSNKLICNILQPLIENALEHGIDKKRGGRGKIVVKMEQDDSNLFISVTDNGPGFEIPLETVMETESKGYGLKNINDRIRIYYGDDYRMQVCRDEQGNTVFSIRVPRIKEEREKLE